MTLPYRVDILGARNADRFINAESPTLMKCQDQNDTIDSDRKNSGEKCIDQFYTLTLYFIHQLPSNRIPYYH